MKDISEKFRCSCATTKIAKDVLSGKANTEDLRLAILYHDNHACVDFMLSYDMLIDRLCLEKQKPVDNQNES